MVSDYLENHPVPALSIKKKGSGESKRQKKIAVASISQLDKRRAMTRLENKQSYKNQNLTF